MSIPHINLELSAEISNHNSVLMDLIRTQSEEILHWIQEHNLLPEFPLEPACFGSLNTKWVFRILWPFFFLFFSWFHCRSSSAWSTPTRDIISPNKALRLIRSLKGSQQFNALINNPGPGIILCMHLANERWRYTVTPSLIGWVHAQNDPCWPTSQYATYNQNNRTMAHMTHLPVYMAFELGKYF